VAVRRFAGPPLALTLLVSRGATLRPSRWVRYGLAFALVAVTLAGVDASRETLPGGGAFLLLLIPVMLGGVALGSGPALTILLLGAAGSLLLVPLRGHPWLSEPADAARLALFLVEGSFAAVAGGMLREAIRSRAHEHPPNRGAKRPGLIEPLTAREQEILRLAAAGMSAKAIGRRLFLSQNTVKSHLSHAYAKLGAHNRAQAIAAGLHWGCLERSALVPPATHVGRQGN
jgi:DNA-binding CsgD family transcriptional regulator